MKIIRIIGLADGGRTPYAGQYVRSYNPQYVSPLRGYEGGIMETTPDPKQALVFADAKAALAKMKETHRLFEAPIRRYALALADAPILPW